MSLIASDYLCSDHGRFDAIVERDASGAAPSSIACPSCGAASDRVLSAVRLKFPLFQIATRGKSDPAPSPYYLDTEPLADGMELEEFTARREKLWEEHRLDEIKRTVGGGGT